MKFLAVFLLIFLFPSKTHSFDRWSDADKTREIVYLTLHAADWGQTLDISKNPTLHTEGNPILGEHPSVGRVNSYFVATALLHVGAVHVLPAAWRPAFQYFWIGVEAGVVHHNYKAGLRFNF